MCLLQLSPLFPKPVVSGDGGGNLFAIVVFGFIAQRAIQQNRPTLLEKRILDPPVSGGGEDKVLRLRVGKIDLPRQRFNFLPHRHRFGLFRQRLRHEMIGDEGVQIRCGDEIIARPPRVHRFEEAALAAQHSGGGQQIEFAKPRDVTAFQSELLRGELVENFHLGPFWIFRVLGDDISIERAPEFVGDVRPFPTAATRPGPDAGEIGMVHDVAQTFRLAGFHDPGVFLPAIDDTVADVKWMRALAIRLALALHLDDLPVFADAQRRIERRHPQKIARLMFDGKNQVRMRLNRVGDFQVVFRVDVKIVSKIPRAIENHLAALYADFIAQDVQQGNVALRTADDGGAALRFAFIGLGARRVKRRVLQIDFPRAHHQPVQRRAALEQLRDLRPQNFLRHGPFQINPPLRIANLVLESGHDRLRQHDELHPRIRLEVRGVGLLRQLFQRHRTLLNPGAGIITLRHNRRINRGERLARIRARLNDLSVVTPIRQPARIAKGTLLRRLAGIVMNHVQHETRRKIFAGFGHGRGTAGGKSGKNQQRNAETTQFGKATREHVVVLPRPYKQARKCYRQIHPPPTTRSSW